MPDLINDELLLLARSLSKNEKRYVRIALSRRGDKDLDHLLDLLFDQVGDPEELNTRVSSHFQDSKKRSKLRRRLYKALLDALIEYESGQNPDLRLHQILQQIIVLKSRGLYGPVEKMIRKGMKLAHHYDRKWALAELSMLQANMQQLHNTSSVKRIAGDAAFQGAYLAVEEFATLQHLLYEDALLAMMFNREGGVGEKEPAFFENLKIKAENATREAGFFIPYIGRHLLSNLYLLQGNPVKMAEEWKKVDELFQEYPQMVQGMELPYFRMLHFRTLMGISLKKYAEAQEALVRLEAARPSQNHLLPAWFQMYFTALGPMAQNLGERPLLIKFTEGYVEAFPIYRERLEGIYVLLLEMLMACCFFILGKYQKALQWIHRCLHNEQLQITRKSIQILATLRLCIYVELEDWENLDEQLTKSRQWLSEEPVFPRFWEISEQMFQTILEGVPAQNLRKALEGFEAGCAELFSHPEEHNVIAHFDFWVWVRAKLAGKEMSDLLPK